MSDLGVGVGEEFGPDDVVDISAHRVWRFCKFMDCEIIGEAARDQAFLQCKFYGRASEWLRRQLSRNWPDSEKDVGGEGLEPSTLSV